MFFFLDPSFYECLCFLIEIVDLDLLSIFVYCSQTYLRHDSSSAVAFKSWRQRLDNENDIFLIRPRIIYTSLFFGKMLKKIRWSICQNITVFLLPPMQCRNVRTTRSTSEWVCFFSWFDGGQKCCDFKLKGKRLTESEIVTRSCLKFESF